SKTVWLSWQFPALIYDLQRAGGFTNTAVMIDWHVHYVRYQDSSVRREEQCPGTHALPSMRIYIGFPASAPAALCHAIFCTNSPDIQSRVICHVPTLRSLLLCEPAWN